MSILKNKYLFYGLVFLLIISSCKVSEQYTTADMDLPEAFVLPDSTQEKMQDAIIPWNEYFKDTLLTHLIQKAFKQNFDLRKADKEIDINEEFYKESKTAFFPTLNLNLFNIERKWSSKNYSSSPESDWYDDRGKTSPENMFINTSKFSSTAAFDWEVDIWGKIRNQKKAAGALYEQSYQIRKALQTEIVATIAEDYYTLLMLDEQLHVARTNYDYRQNTLKMIQLQYNSGFVTALAVQQAKSQVLEAKALVPDLEKQKSIQENKLSLLVGNLSGDIDRKSQLSELDTSYKSVKDIPLYLIQNRPDVLVAQYDLFAANANVGVHQAAKYPNLNIALTGGVGSVLGKNWFNIPGSLLGSFIGGLTAPLLNGRKLKTNYNVALLERDEAEIDFQRSVYAAIIDVKNALVSIDKLEENLSIAEEQVEVSKMAVKSSRMLFRSDFATYLEVITAQGKMLDSQLDLVKARANLLIARVQLYRALGGGWETN